MNNDLISRSALLENIKKSRKAHTSVRSRLTVGDMEQMINGARPVDAEVVRHGRWGRFGKTHHRIVCSACKFPTPFKKQANGYHLAWKSNYCPNCGAKMEQVDD